jgi:hypothetical protein
MQNLQVDLCMSNAGKEILSGFSFFESFCIDEHDGRSQCVTCTVNGKEGYQVIDLDLGKGEKCRKVGKQTELFQESSRTHNQQVFVSVAQPLSVCLPQQLSAFEY